MNRPFPISPSTVRLEPVTSKGIAFTRLAIALGLAKGNAGQAANIAMHRWGNDAPVARILKTGQLNDLLQKAPVSAGTSDAGSWSVELSSAESARAEFFALVRERSIIGRIEGLRRVPMGIRLVSEATGFSGAWVGEGQPIPVSSASYDEDTLPPLKVGAISVVSNELLESADPAAETFIRDQLVQACVAVIDTSFLNPGNSGTTGVEPASISNGVAAITATGNAIADLRELIDAFPGDLGGAVIIGSAESFAAMHDPLIIPGIGARGGELMGIPAIPSRYAGDDITLVDPDSIALAEGGMELDASRQATIQMLDDPTNNVTTPTATNAVSLFQCNSTALKVTKLINWSVMRPSVAVLSGVAES